MVACSDRSVAGWAVCTLVLGESLLIQLCYTSCVQEQEKSRSSTLRCKCRRSSVGVKGDVQVLLREVTRRVISVGRVTIIRTATQDASVRQAVLEIQRVGIPCGKNLPLGRQADHSTRLFSGFTDADTDTAATVACERRFSTGFH